MRCQRLTAPHVTARACHRLCAGKRQVLAESRAHRHNPGLGRSVARTGATQRREGEAVTVSLGWRNATTQAREADRNAENQECARRGLGDRRKARDKDGVCHIVPGSKCGLQK